MNTIDALHDARKMIAFLNDRAEAAEAERDDYAKSWSDAVGTLIAVSEQRDALREQVATLQAQLQEARTEYRVACEDFNELLDKTSDW